MFDRADPDDLTAAVTGRAFADPFPWRFLTRIAELPGRLGGSQGEARAADLTREALPGAPQVEPFEMERWERGRTGLRVRVERSDATLTREFEAVALPYCPAGRIEAPLVDVGHGTPAEIDAADVEGRIAVARTDSPEGERFVHRMESYGHAVGAGAAGFLFSNHVTGQLPPTGALRFGDGAPVPGVGVSRETGAWLTDYAADAGDIGSADDGADAERVGTASGGPSVTAELTVEATTRAGESRNVLAHLGPDTDERVVLAAHLDAHDIAEGALDNGAGLTVATTAARLLAAVADDPGAPNPLERGVTVAAVGCEETGLLGSEAVAERLADRLPGGLDDVRAVVNVDGAGRARDLRAFTHGSAAVASLVEDALEDTGHPFHLERTPHPYSDHWPFLREGVPALQLHSQPPAGGEGPGGGSRGRGFTHTHADTRDKVDPRDLRTHAALTALVVARATRQEFDRRDPAAVADELRESGAEPGMRAAGVWPENWE